jgi:hypothetical protein
LARRKLQQGSILPFKTKSKIIYIPEFVKLRSNTGNFKKMFDKLEGKANMKIILGLLGVILIVFVLASCSLLGGSATPSSTASYGYPDSVVYKLKVSNETYLCSSYSISNTDAGISLKLKEVYSQSSDGKVTWIGQEKDVSAVSIEKIPK